MVQRLRYQQLACVALPWRILIFFALLLLLWSPLALLTYGAGYVANQGALASTLALIALYLCFLGHAWLWGRGVHGWLRPFDQYGLVFVKRFFKDSAIALALGLGLVVGLFGLEVFLGWATLHPRGITTIALEGLGVALGIGLAEELLFRGWLLTELGTGVSKYQAIFWSGFIFAVAHFIKPLPDIISTSPQFLGLLLLGLILGAMRHISRYPTRFQSLGLPMGLHAGLVWGYYIVDVADLVIPSGQVPEWMTGIHGNPLSGLLGVAILSGLAVLAGFKLRSK
ncbi:CPBP family intramembrane glutamic endopeptidase [Leptothoe kymatousa]|uniref:CPBP family intramembrane metalloprotease n=1 Tax=Leptothoe kymatousa TAU-MAC 1615 TaxID=2364775 RepID=A0ABS5Y611_9CYAN|nr:CPBP family intramembrane glutamic endopeptidase [Leptothoe kymatousa]MBT9313294.1 CPBP family intramembrane metalloprotease [Leptothoe kymatousa TAU-MAC 1615]